YSDFPFFFFQAEDGIRDFHVTGVQTCALPILQPTVDGWQLTLTDGSQLECDLAVLADGGRSALREQLGVTVKHTPYGQTALIARSEERRVGKEGSYQWPGTHGRQWTTDCAPTT